MNPEISIVIPAYNRADLLPQALESVFAQTYQNFEVIVSDDGSTDNTEAVIRQFGDRVTYLKNNHSGLPSVARNTALNQANGKYIAFLDSDDLWLPDKLKIQVDVLENNPRVGLVCSNAFLIDADGEEQSDQLYQIPGKGRSGSVFLDLLKDNFVITSSVILRRDTLEKAGIFSEAKELQVGEDYALWLNIALDWQVEYLENPLIIYHDSPQTSIRKKQDMPGYWRGMIYILTSIYDTSLDKTVKRAVKLRLGVHRKHLIGSLFKAHRFGEFFIESGKIIIEQPIFALRVLVFESRQRISQIIKKLGT